MFSAACLEMSSAACVLSRYCGFVCVDDLLLDASWRLFQNTHSQFTVIQFNTSGKK